MDHHSAGTAAVSVLTPQAAISASQTEAQVGLKRGVAGTLLLTGLGLSFITVGNFVAWGFALAQGGIGGLLLALGVVALLFFCLVACLGELSAMMPSAGGAYAFVQRGLGPTAGLLAGAAITLEYVCGTAALATFSASYLESLTGFSGRGVIAILYFVVCILNIAGVGEALGVTLLMAGVAIIGVLAAAAGMLPHATIANLVDVVPAAGHSVWLPFGLAGAWAAVPFVVSFFVTLEGVPFAAEEAKDPARSIPCAMFASLGIGLLLALVVVGFCASGAGTHNLVGAPDPVVAALRHRGYVGGTDWLLLGVNFAAVAALVASFFGGLFASSRMVFHLARERVLPRSLARTNARHAPWLAVLAAAGAAAILTYIGNAEQLVVLLVFGATTCYLLILAAHWRLRRVAPEMPRPYRSPAGRFIPALGMLLAALAFVACFLADIKWSMLGAAVLLLSMLYFRVTAPTGQSMTNSYIPKVTQ